MTTAFAPAFTPAVVVRDAAVTPIRREPSCETQPLLLPWLGDGTDAGPAPAPILVTGAGGPAGRSLLAQLAQRGVPAIGTDMADVWIRRTEVLRVSAARHPDYVDELRGIVQVRGVRAVVPTVSEELPRIAEHRETLAHDVPVVVARPDAVRVADDKLATARRLADAGVPVPAFLAGADVAADPGRVERELGYPVVVKPRVSRGGRGVRVVRDRAALGTVTADDIVQSFASGVEYAPCLWVPGPQDADARPVVVVLVKTGLKDGEVGNATGVRRVDGPEVQDVAVAALAAALATGLTGPVDVDVRRDAAGTPRVLELNARFGANSAAAPEVLDRVLDRLGDA